MKLWQWERGRQNGEYSKFTIAFSKRLKFDCYIIVIPDGAEVPWHIDPTPSGFEHHRVNITLWKPKHGGDTTIDLGGPRGEAMPPNYVQPGRWYHFRPDLYRHCVSEAINGNLVLLSFGWLRKIP